MKTASNNNVISMLQDNTSPRERFLRIGYVPLIDCAPFLVAQEEKLFEKHGVNVKLSREPGWATVRDKLVYGELDAAQSVIGLVIALNHGLGCLKTPTKVPLIINANGNAITLSKELSPDLVGKGEGLVNVVAARKAKDLPQLTFATVHPYSSHLILLNKWLLDNGVTPGVDVNIVFLPPNIAPSMLKSKSIDGFCVGEPWNSAAILDESGWCPVTSLDISEHHPEKVFAVRDSVFEHREEEVLNATKAILEACKLCQAQDYRKSLIKLLKKDRHMRDYSNAIDHSFAPEFKDGAGGSKALPHLHLFAGDRVNCPTLDKANWAIEGMKKAGLLKNLRLENLQNSFKPELFEQLD